MKAIGYNQSGGIEALVELDIAMPTPGPHDLLVRVRAVSVNPVDVKTRAGSATQDDPRILGFDAAGVVERVGSEVTLFKAGDDVFYAGAIDRPGSNAEYQLVDERIVGAKPISLDWTAAAALPLTSLTAFELLFDRMRVPFGSFTAAGTLLVINGAGGVGSILIQLARRLTGLRVVATASRPETIAWVRSLGAHDVIDHHEALDEELGRIGIGQAEYVAGLTATDRHLGAIAKLIAPQGTLALIDDPETFDVVPFKRKAVTVAWELMFTRSLFHTPDMPRQGVILNEIASLVDAGVLRSTMTQDVGPLTAENLRRAHAIVESGSAYGKTVLSGIQ
jgi:zinc-binding alcohol dehydrogenase family protein